MNETLIQSSFYYVPAFVEADIVVDDKLLAKARLIRRIAVTLALLGGVFMAVYFTPSLFAAVKMGGDKWVLEDQTIEATAQSTKNLSYQPALDESLPLGNSLSIPKLGVKTPIYEDSYENHELALKKGAWRVNDFGSPADRSMPTIVAAHRFGYLAWTNEYRHTHSFYNLPKLSQGDTVEIVWRQRKYVYEIYAASEGEEISDYAADLILYTCRDLNTNIRIFRYARLLEV